MGLSFTEKVALKLQGFPVGRIEKAMADAQAAGISITQADICAHLRCGGRIESVVEGLVLAKHEGIPATWHELCVIDLASGAGKFDVVGAVRESMQVHDRIISTFASDMKGRLEGTCRDGSRIRAECRITYRLPPSHVFGSRLDFVHERLAVRIGALIFDAATSAQLHMSRTEHEASLFVLAKSVMPMVQALDLNYQVAT